MMSYSSDVKVCVLAAICEETEEKRKKKKKRMWTNVIFISGGKEG
jgi:hypothetical protein